MITKSIEMVTESGKPVRVYRGLNEYVTVIECQSALNNLD